MKAKTQSPGDRRMTNPSGLCAASALAASSSVAAETVTNKDSSWPRPSAHRYGGSTGDPLSNDRQRRIAFRANQLQTRRTYALRALTDLLLHQFDQLHELGHRIESKQREEPLINASGIFPMAVAPGLE